MPKKSNVIAVKKGTDPGTLKIEKHEVHPNALKQAIVWQLEASLQRGNFTSFKWEDPQPAAGTFGVPEIAPDGNSLTVSDLNDDPKKKGNFAYTITLEMEGTLYTSASPGSDMLLRDPIIINR